jgi:hypothetical protein
MKLISYISFLIGVSIVAIWSVQQISDVKILDNPLAGSSIFLILAFLLNQISKNNTEN